MKVNLDSAALRLAGQSGKQDIHNAAQEFEAVLVGKLLEDAFSATGEASDGTMIDFGREQLARLIAQRGGLGLAQLFEKSLDSSHQASAPTPTAGAVPPR